MVDTARRLAGQLHRHRLPVAILVSGLVLAAVIALVTLRSSPSRHSAAPPVPPAPSPTQTAVAGTTRSAAVAPRPHLSARSPARTPWHCTAPTRRGNGTAPVHICIPALQVSATMMQLGLNSDRTVEVPPLSRVRDAGWYKYSAPPGNVGPTVILGHVDSARYGDGIFFHLGQLHAGDRVLITRADGRVATFRVDRLSEVPKSRFPTDAVYGATSGPALRLITCGGRFDAATRNYIDNIIAYGTLLSLTRPH